MWYHFYTSPTLTIYFSQHCGLDTLSSIHPTESDPLCPLSFPYAFACDSLPHPLRLDPTQSWFGWGITSTQNPLWHHIFAIPLFLRALWNDERQGTIYLWQTEALLWAVTGVSIKVEILSIPAGVAASKLTHLDSDCMKHYKHCKNI